MLAVAAPLWPYWPYAVAIVVIVATWKFLGLGKPTMSAQDRMMHGLIERMHGPSGFDYVIICCSNLSGERFWQARLEETMLKVTGHSSMVLCVHEDWEGGAGNGLGTLYALVKAIQLARAKYGVELLHELGTGKSVALYHTAGKGTRLAPLPGAENNNKPAVKLPELFEINGEARALTILEAVIRQTSILSPRSKGRLAVFWGDQVFVPSTESGVDAEPTHHADILAGLGPMPSEAQWTARALHQYGLIATDKRGDAVQLEKVSHADAVRLLPSGVLQVGTSLGSFSVSCFLLCELLKEFKAELDKKTGQFDADPHFWMPVTLSEHAYADIMLSKGTDEPASKAHWARMQRLKARVTQQMPQLRFFGAVPVGQTMHWWDYGRLELYKENNVLVTESSASAKALRHFLHAVPRVQSSSLGPVNVARSACVLGCTFRGGSIGARAVLVNVKAPYVDVDDCVLVNVSSNRPIYGRGGVLYNVVDAEVDGKLSCDAAHVRADVFVPETANLLPRLGSVASRHLKVHSGMEVDGGKAWKVRLPGNELSYEEIHALNKDVDVRAAQEAAARQHKAIIVTSVPASH
ncbi:hypothetical protein T492DRAFT_1056129 [Pavlovales sp. CCMP2436]|nr:hypothetical protein T492DRAFT_1056129 [Pavlovales sp. CCMP2436]|mmetsp:Transcript_11544/g.27004  ORF Transcript_11544/g.27004 Transcript_11544/m.27004 type:complete len:579 (+) Transcript_11544:61-1797(+)